MRKTEFQRTTPESVGISSKSILELLDRLEEDYSEIHSLMVMRQKCFFPGTGRIMILSISDSDGMRPALQRNCHFDLQKTAAMSMK